jgi:uncharacterized membrane protein SpoIIM required for sporulation
MNNNHKNSENVTVLSSNSSSNYSVNNIEFIFIIISIIILFGIFSFLYIFIFFRKNNKDILHELNKSKSDQNIQEFVEYDLSRNAIIKNDINLEDIL